MAQTAANLVEHVLPTGVPLRQWVLTLPHSLRARLAYDGALLAAVARVFADSVLGWYRRRMDFGGIARGHSGAVVVIQRSSSDLALNPHLHGLFLDGVYREDGDGELAFHVLPRLRTAPRQARGNRPVTLSLPKGVLQVVRVRLVRLLVRRGVLADDPELTMLEDELPAREPALAQLAASAVRGLPSAGAERRRATPIELPGHPGVTVCGALSVAELGFSLHAATRAGGWDERAREAAPRRFVQVRAAPAHRQRAARADARRPRAPETEKTVLGWNKSRVILPMSHFARGSTIDGIRRMAKISTSNIESNDAASWSSSAS